MAANGQSQQTAPDKLICLERTEYVKWCVEGAFEFVRKMEFPNCCSRMNCKYFFESLENFKILYEAGWKQEPVIYDEACDAMLEKQDVETVLSCARRYFSGRQSTEPVWEIVSDKPAKAVKDISSFLKSMEE